MGTGDRCSATWARSFVWTWGQMLKRAGYDGIHSSGAADAPVYLWVTEGQAEIRPAQHCWGVDTYDVDPLLVDDLEAVALGNEPLDAFANSMNALMMWEMYLLR